MRILLVEDEVPLANRIKSVLKKERYQIEVAFDGSDGLDEALTETYDLIILDIMLPGMDGIEVLKEIREAGLKVPILMLTAKDKVQDKVSGLDAGADDYLTKPFAIPELLARIRSLLRRESDEKTSTLSAHNLEVDTAKGEVRRAGTPVKLTPKEYSLLELLLYNKNRVLSRLSIAEHVWGDNFDLFSMTNFVDVHIKNLRKKLKDDGDDRIIQTVRGVGYIIKEP
ncbi:MAG: response regulator transcription factor [Candidatus Latescibacterota bacterium]|nr:MAG: response regulator transcription factor [Candidatus Latescibacterota bacterium]